jgi:hypothetical protein
VEVAVAVVRRQELPAETVVLVVAEVHLVLVMVERVFQGKAMQVVLIQVDLAILVAEVEALHKLVIQQVLGLVAMAYKVHHLHHLMAGLVPVVLHLPDIILEEEVEVHRLLQK